MRNWKGLLKRGLFPVVSIFLIFAVASCLNGGVPSSTQPSSTPVPTGTLTPSPSPSSKPTTPLTVIKIATSTTLISAVVNEVGAGLVSATNVVHPTKNPLEFELTADSLKPLSDARLFLLMNYEAVKFPDSLIKQANPGITVVRIDVPGDWMIPSAQIQAVDAVTKILSQYDTANSATYEKQASDYKARVRAMEQRILTQLGKIKTEITIPEIAASNVICSETIAEFVKWTGLNVVATFGEPETSPPEKIAAIIEKGRASKATVLYESYQDWKRVGEEIASELKISMSFLSRYPGAFANSETWERAIQRNIERLVSGWCQT